MRSKQDSTVTMITVFANFFIISLPSRIKFLSLKYIRNMSKLLFLFDESGKCCVRVSEKGFCCTCEEFGVSPSKIIALNYLDSEPKAGRLILIERKENSFLYTVKVSDTAKSICERFSISEEELFSINKIEYIYPYQKIELPIK